jgi:hypothetical protein
LSAVANIGATFMLGHLITSCWRFVLYHAQASRQVVDLCSRATVARQGAGARHLAEVRSGHVVIPIAIHV